MSKLYYSNFSYKFYKNGVIAYLHSLRLKPVFVDAKYEDIVNKISQSDNYESIFSSLPVEQRKEAESIITALIDAKIFNNDPVFDEKIILKIRNGLPEPYVQIAYFVLTENCNFACDYCFIENNMNFEEQKERIMSIDTAQKGLDYFCRLILKQPDSFEDEKNIIFYGGEPLLNFEVLTYLVSKIREYQSCNKLPQKTNISVITNGSLLTPDIAKKLKEMKINIAVSLDGSDEKSNKCRCFCDGSPAFKDIIDGVENAISAGCDCGLSVTLTEDTISDFEKVATAISKYNIASLGFNIMMTDKNFIVSDDYNQKAAEFIIKGFEYFREKGIYEDRIMRKAKAFVDGKIYLYDCGATGGNQIVIAPDGEVGLCHGYLHSRETFISNVWDDNFSPVDNETYIEWRNRTPINMPECLDCIALGICGGGCPLNAKNNGESIWDLDERFCTHAKTTLNWLIWDLFDKTING